MLNGLHTSRERAVEAAMRTLAAAPSVVNREWKVPAEELKEVSMCRAGREFFGRNLHADNLTAYYLRSCLDRPKG